VGAPAGVATEGLRGCRLLAYTDASVYGGAEASLGMLLSALDPALDVVVAGQTAAVVERVAATRPGASPVVVRPAVLEHVRLLRRRRPHLLHVNLRTPYSCSHALVAGVVTRGVGTLAVEHLPLSSRSRRARLVKRWTSRRLGAHVAVSDATARAVEQDAGLPAGSIRTIRNGVPDLGLVSRPSPPAGAIAVVARLDRQKGIDVLLDALAEVPDASAVIVGDGPERGALVAQAAALGLSGRVTFLGWRDDVRAQLESVDVLVLPSRYEGLPLVVLEAMLAGVPVVATEVGGLRECIEPERTGVLVPPGDPRALAAALRRLLGDADRRERLAAAAREEAVRRFTAKAMADAYERLYLELLA
jgi:glycosyltransferase involved in cell wall biosynthesis